MACFIVSAAEAAVVSAVEKSVEKKELQEGIESRGAENVTKIPMSTKLKWLYNMLLGGTILLIFEHVWHGEIVPWFPFLTAMSNPEDAMEMLKEIATVGVSMAVSINVVWVIVCKVADSLVNRAVKDDARKNIA